MNHKLTQHPAHLWVGSSETLASRLCQELKTFLCTQKNCNSCISCKQIDSKQHSSCTWLIPENTHTKNTLDIIFEIAAFKREVYDPYFFVLEKAELLNQASANRLLKLLEEPPTGYYFILLTDSVARILPTIRSRCVTNFFNVPGTEQFHPLVNFFIQKSDPLTWIQALEVQQPTPQDCVLIINQALAQSIKNSENSSSPNDKRIHILTNALTFPPMPGSAKIYLKNIFLQLLPLHS